MPLNDIVSGAMKQKMESFILRKQNVELGDILCGSFNMVCRNILRSIRSVK